MIILDHLKTCPVFKKTKKPKNLLCLSSPPKAYSTQSTLLHHCRSKFREMSLAIQACTKALPQDTATLFPIHPKATGGKQNKI